MVIYIHTHTDIYIHNFSFTHIYLFILVFSLDARILYCSNSLINLPHYFHNDVI